MLLLLLMLLLYFFRFIIFGEFVVSSFSPNACVREAEERGVKAGAKASGRERGEQAVRQLNDKRETNDAAIETNRK